MLKVFKLIMDTVLMISKPVIWTTYNYGMLSYYHEPTKKAILE